MATGEEIPLEPAFAQMLRENLHHPTVGREVIVAGQPLGHPGAVRCFEDGLQTVRCRLVGTHDAEPVGVGSHHVAQPRAEHVRPLHLRTAMGRYVDCVRAEVG